MMSSWTLKTGILITIMASTAITTIMGTSTSIQNLLDMNRVGRDLRLYVGIVAVILSRQLGARKVERRGCVVQRVAMPHDDRMCRTMQE